MVLLETLDPEELRLVQVMIQRHAALHRQRPRGSSSSTTGPTLAAEVRAGRSRATTSACLQALERAQVAGLSGDEAVMWAFEANKAGRRTCAGDD